MADLSCFLRSLENHRGRASDALRIRVFSICILDSHLNYPGRSPDGSHCAAFAIEQPIWSRNELVELQSELMKLNLSQDISSDYTCFTVYDVTPQAELVTEQACLGGQNSNQVLERLRLSIMLTARALTPCKLFYLIDLKMRSISSCLPLVVLIFYMF